MMNEQYAFAIAFDQHESDSCDQAMPVDWPSLMSQIETVVEFEGFPPFRNARWEEFGEGRIYWGPQHECKTLQAILSTFPVSIYEERNLEAGYYTCSFGVYHVDDSGNILGLDSRAAALNGFDILPRESIPMDAYKTQQVEPDIEAQFQQALMREREGTNRDRIDRDTTVRSPHDSQAQEPLSTPDGAQEKRELAIASRGEAEPWTTAALSDVSAVQDQGIETQHINGLKEDSTTVPIGVPMEAERTAVEPEPLASLTQLVQDQGSRIQELEQLVEQHQSQAHDLQLMLDRKVDPEMHSQLEQHATAQSEEISDLEQELNQLKQSYAQVLASESQRISAEEYERLGQASAEQGKTIADLENKVQTLQAALDTAKLEMTRKVDEELLEKALADKAQQVEIVQGLEQQIVGLEDTVKQVRQDAAQKIERQDFESIKHQVSQLTVQVQDLEQDKQQLLNEVGQWTQVANAKVEAQDFEALQQQSAEQTRQLAELQQAHRLLQQELSNWKQIAEDKIERVEYEAALEQIERLQAKLSRSWIERLRDWFRGR